MNPVVVHKNNQTCEIKKCVSNVCKAKWLRKTRRCNLHLRRKQQKLSHENPNSLRVEKEISAVTAVAYSSFQSVKHTRVLHLPLNVISLIFPPLPPPLHFGTASEVFAIVFCFLFTMSDGGSHAECLPHEYDSVTRVELEPL